MAPKSARITLSFGRDSDGPKSVGYINMLGLGFALYQVWLYMTVFSAAKTFRNDDAILSFAPFAAQNHAILAYVFMIASAVALVAFGLLRKNVAPFFESRRSVAFAGVLGIAGTLMLQLGAGASTISVVVAAALMGVCAAIFVILLGSAFAEFEFATCVLDSAVSVAVGLILAVAFVNWIPSPASGFVAVLMPAFMTAAFWKKRHSVPGSSESIMDAGYLRIYLVQFASSMALFGLVVGALRVVCADRLLSHGGITVELVIDASSIIGVLLFVLAIAASKKETMWDSLFRIVTPFAVLGIASMIMLSSDMRLVASFFVTLGYVGLAALLWIFLASIARSLNGSSIFAFGIGYGIMQATSALGYLLADSLLEIDLRGAGWSSFGASNQGLGLFQPEGAMVAANLSVLALVLCVALSFAYAISPRYREMRGIFSTVLSELLQGRKADQDDENEEHGVVGDVAGEKALPAKEDAGKSAGDRLEAAKAAEVHAKEQPAGDGDAPVEQPQREDKGSFVRRCEELSAKYGLSTREKEVFFLLAKGHNAAYITEKLCVSKSTAKTHINHIYKKVDIHTQQELLKMVEDRARGPYGQRADGPSFGSMGAAASPDYDALMERALKTKALHDAEMSRKNS